MNLVLDILFLTKGKTKSNERYMLLCEIKAMMGEFLALLVLSGLLQHLLPNCSCMEFDLDGKYLLGGLFDVHTTTTYSVRDRPLELDCSK